MGSNKYPGTRCCAITMAEKLRMGTRGNTVVTSKYTNWGTVQLSTQRGNAS